MFLLIDNYDSFTYNLYQYFGSIVKDIKVVRNDEITIEEVTKLNPNGIIISPGPKDPKDAGICVEVIKAFHKTTPIFGVCLGQQCIGAAFGGKVVHAKKLFHGKKSRIKVNTKDLLFKDVKEEIDVARYHSLVVEKESLPDTFEILSEFEGEIMAMKLKNYPVYGVQFHPESILTEDGLKIIKNFVKIAEDMPFVLKPYVEKMCLGENLTKEEMTRVMSEIMQGKVEPIQIAGFLTALKAKGETVEEIATGAKVLRSVATPCPISGDDLLDIVGTGGDGADTFNISSCSSIVVAACGTRVAKHGNRSVSSQCGSADVLETLGVNIMLTPEDLAKCMDKVNMGFLFAPIYHSAMRHVGPVRKALGYRTIFNVLGPLINPAGAKYQLAGVFDKSLIMVYAKVLKSLGLKKALAIHGSDGLDEITITGDTYVAELNNGEITEYKINPEQFGIKCAKIDAIKGSTKEVNAQIIRNILDGEKGPYRDTVLLNSGAALYAANAANSIAEGIKMATEAIDSKKAKATLEALTRF